ncbi:MAG: 1,4-dihydroxy-2-naphthoate octaprenyltransferase [Cytophagales bacterium]|nr:MAG: 1,4-dihydroxy-2-naphthoate octaprenyltransferase [Cytophagales bacterium]
MNFKKWIIAFRLRTLPLSLSSIGMGGVLALYSKAFDWSVFLMTMLTTIFLQILSNLANDLGDFENGADLSGRVGPERAVQMGMVSPKEMKIAVVLFSLFSLISGIYLLIFSIGVIDVKFFFFLFTGLLCIYAAVKYTFGKSPYGYIGLGDISVFIFFGIVGVCGSFYLHTFSFEPLILLPAIACGAFATNVLNLNNMRDIVSDKVAGKYTIPVRLGLENAKIYHYFLTSLGIFASILYAFLVFSEPLQFLCFIPLFGMLLIAIKVKNKSGVELDPFLKYTALTSLAIVLFWFLGYFLS